MKGAQSQALRRGFSELAGYIFGGNTTSASVSMTTPVTQRPSEKIAMTTPVTQSGDGDIWTVSFTMPREYTRETLPVPNTDTIRFVETTPERQIVLRFSGIAGTAKLAKQDATLQAIAAQAGVSLGAGPFYYFLRRSTDLALEPSQRSCLCGGVIYRGGFQNVARLAVERCADFGECLEPDAFHFA